MDDEEVLAYQAMQEPLYRVETGNYEYRYQNENLSIQDVLVKTMNLLLFLPKKG